MNKHRYLQHSLLYETKVLITFSWIMIALRSSILTHHKSPHPAPTNPQNKFTSLSRCWKQCYLSSLKTEVRDIKSFQALICFAAGWTEVHGRCADKVDVHLKGSWEGTWASVIDHLNHHYRQEVEGSVGF